MLPHNGWGEAGFVQPLAQPGSPRVLAGTRRERQGDVGGTVTSRHTAFLHRQLRTSTSLQLPVRRALSHQALTQILHPRLLGGVITGLPPLTCMQRGAPTAPISGSLQATGAPTVLPWGPRAAQRPPACSSPTPTAAPSPAPPP